jgi:phage tail tape-measure protein
MEQQSPGILQQLTQQLKDFFEVVDEIDEEGEAQSKPAKVSSKDDKEQLKKFKDAEHRPTWQEKAMNTRYSGTQRNKNDKVLKRFPREMNPEDRKAIRK